MTTRVTTFLICAAGLSVTSCSKNPDVKPDQAFDQSVIHENSGLVSLIELLANPAKYHGKQVLVYGVVGLGFEVCGVFPSYDLALTPANGIWIEDGIPQKYLNLEREPGSLGTPLWLQGYVAGTFDATMRGHMGMWSGTLKQVSRFEVYPRDAALGTAPRK